jgi:hypothetical protein
MSHRKRTRTARIRRESSRTALKREATSTQSRTAVRAELRAVRLTSRAV